MSINGILGTYAIILTSFPAVMMFQSCNVLIVIIVALICTGVRDQTLKLRKNKIIIGIISTVGVFLF